MTRRGGEVVAWLGVAGGVGVTSAVVAAAGPGDLLVDLDLGHAALASRVGISGDGISIGALLDGRTGDIDGTSVLGLARDAPHRVGVRVIAAPREPEVADAVDADRVGELLGAAAAAGTWRRVLLDCGSRFDPVVDVACAHATSIVVVARDDPDGLRRAGDLVALLRRGAISARIELDLRSARGSGRHVPAGRAAFDLGVAPHEPGDRRAGIPSTRFAPAVAALASAFTPGRRR